MALGNQPYKDFQFFYGPGMLYPQFWLYRIGMGYLSIEAAYFITLLCHWLLGVFLIYKIFTYLGGEFNRTTAFLCVFLAMLNPTLGLNYTPLRFALPVISVYVLHRSVTIKALPYRILFSSFIFPFISLAFSPEIGIAVMGAFIAYTLIIMRSPQRVLTPYCLGWLIALPAALTFFGTDYLQGIIRFGGGAYSFPILPTLHIIGYLAAICFILPRLFILALDKSSDISPLAAALLTLAMLLIPAALGRCDMGHIFYNGLPVFIIVIALISVKQHKWIRFGLFACFILIFPVGNGIAFLSVYKEPMHRAISETVKARGGSLFGQRAHQDESAPSSSFKNGNKLVYSKGTPHKLNLAILQKYDALGTPFGFDDEIERFLKLTGKACPDYFPDMFITSPADVNRKLQFIGDMQYILVDHNLFRMFEKTTIWPNTDDTKMLPGLFLFPVDLKDQVNLPYSPKREIVAFIINNYRPIEIIGTYFILKRINVN